MRSVSRKKQLYILSCYSWCNLHRSQFNKASSCTLTSVAKDAWYCLDGTLKNQPNKMGMTPQHISTIPTSCAILPTMHNKKLSTYSLNEHGTHHCSLHSLPHKKQSISDSATFSSKKTYHTDPALLTVSAYKTDYIPACSISTTLHPPTTYTLSTHINLPLHTQQYPPNCLPQPCYAHN